MEKTTKASQQHELNCPAIEVFIQTDNFNHSELYQQLADIKPTPGAIVTFTGLVRDMSALGEVSGILLEHYPGMTEKSLHGIGKKAKQRWLIDKITIVHRTGKIAADEQIVFVGVASKHRKEAFQTCEFIMDYLKNDAPFWKQELTNQGNHWVEAKESDIVAKQKWEK